MTWPLPLHAWAKAPRLDDDVGPRWLSLRAHLLDAAEVAGLLWDDWLTAGGRDVLTADAGARARDLVVAAAGVHDVGKLSPAFAAQVPAMQVHMESVGYPFGAAAGRDDARRLPHGVAGQLIVEDWLARRGVPAEHAERFGAVIGGHHGVPPTPAVVADARVRGSLLGTGVWAQARDALIDDVLSACGVPDLADHLRQVRLSDASQAIVTGIVILADWIASNADLFPLSPQFEQPAESAQVRAARAWAQLGLARPWVPTDDGLDAEVSALLSARFGMAMTARDVQRLTLDAVREMTGPGLVLVEAAMGSGKTEASLLAAEVLARRTGRAGVFYGLPTRATADAMFARVLDWWQRVPDAHGGTVRSVQLRHGTSVLNPDLAALPRRAPHGVTDDDALVPGGLVDVGRDEGEVRRHGPPVTGVAVAHHWTSGRKKGALADTVVATVDHDLMMALSARHVVLRHLGLVRQVVVLDEVHAADTWMLAYLERSLEWLGRYGVPVIAMSATLPPGLRTRLVHAYVRGRRAAAPPPVRLTVEQRRAMGRRTAAPLPEVPASSAYPLVTVVQDETVAQHTAEPVERREVELRWLTDDDSAVADVLRPVVEAGGCALVVCNTVSRARARYEALRAALGAERVFLAHSRYTARDRVARDDRLRTTFGPPHRCDPELRRGQVVVATQVAEQSLDIDLDVLVTDLAPADVLLQRIGRLHRHDRPRPAPAQRAVCHVTAFDVTAGPVVESGAEHVYGALRVLRTAALVDDRVRTGRPVVVPHDVPDLVARCYDDDLLGDPAWGDALAQAAAEDEAARLDVEQRSRAFVLPAPDARTSIARWLERNVGESEDPSGGAQQVRAPDGGFELALVSVAEDGWQLLPHWGDDRPLHRDAPLDRDTSHALASSIVRVPGWVTRRPRDVDAVFTDLNRHYVRAWQDDPVMGGQLVLPLGPDGAGHMGPFTVTYDPDTGLEVTRA